MPDVPYCLTSADLPRINEIQANCYPAAMIESDSVMAARLAASPGWIWGIRDDFGLCAYLFCHPCHQGYLGRLNAAASPVAGGDTLYLHDLAIHPRARGRKLAQILVHQAWDRARATGLAHSALVSVQGSQAFWAQLGYRTCSKLTPDQTACLADYPPTAHYMVRMLDA
ncbi:GNAT family N-acetyltransferase [Castellaniella sp.]|uniref:GNAT family N-acetyltransferase n=1 Tax=Castellaniella sp. TaxID=1955812 RepID=UPI002AFE5442|nr:GNAT family N-acetyltransferase [Castellaniella sp.]